VTQSAKRFGLEVEGDLELESRLRRIEVAMTKAGLGNQDALVVSRGSGAVPQVTGLSLGGTIPGGFTVNWNASTISDLRRYDIQFATDLAFTTGLQKFTAVTTTWAFTTAATEVYFARVRAVNNSASVGLWSITLNTTTGQAATEDIEDGAVTIEKVDQEDLGSALALRGYIDGLIISNGTDADHDIDIAAGITRDAANTVSISLVALTKQLDFTWVAGTDAGGRALGVSWSANTWYHVFIITDDAVSVVDGGFDTDVAAVNLLAGSTFTKYRRIGSVLTDGSSNIIAFFQHGDKVFWQVPTLDIERAGGTVIGDAEVLDTVKVPSGLIVEAILNVATNAGDGKFIWIYDPTTTSATPSNSVAPLGNTRVYQGGIRGADQLHVFTDTSQQIAMRSSAGSTTVRVATIGYTDQRGKDGGL
jgi:hypothetical protein